MCHVSSRNSNDTLLFITVFLCLYAGDAFYVGSCNEYPIRENCGVARQTIHARVLSRGLFCKPG